MIAAQLLFDAVVLGAATALVALGFVLILNATGAVNFAQGQLVMAGGYGGVALAAWWPEPGLVLLPPLLVGMAVLGLAVAAVAYLPLRRRPPEAVFVSTIAVGIVLSNAASLIFGPELHRPPALAGEAALRLGGLVMPTQALAVLVVAALLIGGLQLLFTRTQLGRQLRAAAADRETAASLGIRVDALALGTFAAGAALAGAAGLLLGRGTFVSPTDGADHMLKAYVAVVLGGWGSIPGAVAGAMLIAAFEVLYPALPALLPGLPDGPLFSQNAAGAVLDGLILAILAVRPGGLFARAASR